MSVVDSEDYRCPVCRARFRGACECSRCGADLRPLMVLAARAWRLRESAREALGRRELAEALEFARESERLQATAEGRRLAALLLVFSEEIGDEF